MVDGTTFVAVPVRNDWRIHLVRIGDDESLTIADSKPQIEVTTLVEPWNARPFKTGEGQFVAVVSRSGDSVTVFKVTSDESLSLVMSVDDRTVPALSEPKDAEVLTIAGAQKLYVGSSHGGEGAISVFDIAENGALSHVDTQTIPGLTRYRDLSSVTLGGETFLTASASDATRLLHVAADGTLTVAQSSAVLVNQSHEVFEMDGRPFAFAAPAFGSAILFEIGGGDDTLNGTAGDDTLLGFGGDDSLTAFGGDDILRAGVGADEAWGRGGNDTLIGGDGRDTLSGGNGADRIVGGVGRDRLFGEAGGDDLRGGEGNDTISGGDGGDRMIGHDGNDRISGGKGGDLLRGHDGNDRLRGGGAHDTLRGGDGQDTLDGQSGRNLVEGGGGSDVFVLKTSNARMIVQDFDPHGRVSDILRIDAGRGSDASWFRRFEDEAVSRRGDLIWDIGDGKRLVLEDVRPGVLGPDDFDFF